MFHFLLSLISRNGAILGTMPMKLIYFPGCFLVKYSLPHLGPGPKEKVVNSCKGSPWRLASISTQHLARIASKWIRSTYYTYTHRFTMIYTHKYMQSSYIIYIHFSALYICIIYIYIYISVTHLYTYILYVHIHAYMRSVHTLWRCGCARDVTRSGDNSWV